MRTAIFLLALGVVTVGCHERVPPRRERVVVVERRRPPPPPPRERVYVYP